jgi:hypothetical protein
LLAPPAPVVGPEVTLVGPEPTAVVDVDVDVDVAVLADAPPAAEPVVTPQAVVLEGPVLDGPAPPGARRLVPSTSPGPQLRRSAPVRKDQHLPDLASNRNVIRSPRDGAG